MRCTGCTRCNAARFATTPTSNITNEPATGTGSGFAVAAVAGGNKRFRWIDIRS